MLGYVLHRKRELKISKIVFVLILSGMLFPYQMSILGLYKLIRSLGLMNHLASVIFINIACNIPLPHLCSGVLLQRFRKNWKKQQKLMAQELFVFLENNISSFKTDCGNGNNTEFPDNLE